MKALFMQSLEYTFHFNNKVLEALISNNDLPEKSLKLINHTINSHEIWNSRIENKSLNIDVWGMRTLEELKLINQMNYYNSLAIIDKFDFEKLITYTNTKGDTFVNSIQDILFHITNHSTYHRAQIATDFKNNGFTPLVTDYIFYKRSQI